MPSHVDTTTHGNHIGNALLPELSNLRCVKYHDRQTVHRSKGTDKWFADKKVQARLLPPRAAVLNPIENLWLIVSHKVYAGMRTSGFEYVLSAAIKVA